MTTDDEQSKILEEQLALVDAHKAGKTIQSRTSDVDKWIDLTNPSRSWAYCEYRVKPCINGCKHVYQDKLYGHGWRVMNPVKNGGYRCTVCGKVQE